LLIMELSLSYYVFKLRMFLPFHREEVNGKPRNDGGFLATHDGFGVP